MGGGRCANGPAGGLLQRKIDEQRIDVAKQRRIGIREDNDVGVAGGNFQSPVRRSGPMEFGKYLVRDPLPADIEILAPFVLAANSIEIAMIADDDQQAGVAILRAVQTAEGEVVESDEREKLFGRRYGNSEFDFLSGGDIKLSIGLDSAQAHAGLAGLRNGDNKEPL